MILKGGTTKMDEQLETFEQPEGNFADAFEGIGKDIEDSCNELTNTLNNLDF